jgi:histone H3/H4
VDRRDKDKVYQAALERIGKMIAGAAEKVAKEAKRH